MPIIGKSVESESKEPAVAFRVFKFHGMKVDFTNTPNEGVAECPFCQNGRKWYVNALDTRWKCMKCNCHGNAIDFLRRLHQQSMENTSDEEYKQLAAERKLLDPSSLKAWGVCKSLISHNWIIPGYSTSGKVTTLYKYVKITDEKGKSRMTLLPTADFDGGGGHGLLTPGGDIAGSAKRVYCCEGLWDGIALWETLKHTREDYDGTYEYTNNVSVLKEVAVMACPTATIFFQSWAPKFLGKVVSLMFDNDHPKTNPNTRTTVQAGLDGMKRAARILTRAEQPVPLAALHYVDWSQLDPARAAKDGFDVHDYLCEHKTLPERVQSVNSLFKMLVPVPEEWTEGARDGGRFPGLRAGVCESWKELTDQWGRALQWRKTLEDTLAVMLAVAASTDKVSDQLFLQVIGDAGSGKSSMCDAMLTSKRCYPIEHLTGFISGWKDPDGKDVSLLARVNHKTMVTSEGDVVMSGPSFDEVMSQQRRIFDGVSGASYKNSAEDKRYTGLRTPWIIAGTPALMDKDQSRLGDRFLRVCVDKLQENEQISVMRQALRSMNRSMKQTSNGDPEGCMEADLCLAYQLTGGYVNYLRDNEEKLFGAVEDPSEEQEMRIMELAMFTGLMRTQLSPKKDAEPTTEVPVRLAKQFDRLGHSLCAVFGRKKFDDDILRIVTKVAIDTARGRTLRLAETLYKAGRDGVAQTAFSDRVDEDQRDTRRVNKFLEDHGIMEFYDGGGRFVPRYRLTDKIYNLMKSVYGEGGPKK